MANCGLKGEKGVQGNQGPRGLKGDTGPPGPRGQPGPPGTQGVQGVQGLAGLPGVNGLSIKGDKGETGYPGPRGLPGPPGPKGDPGDKGEKGDQGEKGIKGDTGLPGPFASVPNLNNVAAVGSTVSSTIGVTIPTFYTTNVSAGTTTSLTPMNLTSSRLTISGDVHVRHSIITTSIRTEGYEMRIGLDASNITIASSGTTTYMNGPLTVSGVITSGFNKTMTIGPDASNITIASSGTTTYFNGPLTVSGVITSGFNKTMTIGPDSLGITIGSLGTTTYFNGPLSINGTLLSSSSIGNVGGSTTLLGELNIPEQTTFTLPPHILSEPIYGDDATNKGYVDKLIGNYSGSGLNLYLNNSTNSILGYKELSNIIRDTEDASVILTSALGVDNHIQSFITPLGYPGTLTVPVGLWNMSIYAYTNNTDGNISIKFKLYAINTLNVERLIASSTNTDIDVNVTDHPVMYSLTAPVTTEYPLELTDRLVIKIYCTGVDVGDAVLYTKYENVYYSFVNTSLSGGTSLLSSTNTWTANNTFARDTIVDGSLNVMRIQGGTTGTNTLKIGVVNTGDITIGRTATNTIVDGSLNVVQIQGGTTGTNTLKIGVVNTGDITIGRTATNTIVDGSFNVVQIQGGTTGTNTLKIGVANTGDITIGRTATNTIVDGSLNVVQIQGGTTGTNTLKIGVANTGDITIGRTATNTIVDGSLNVVQIQGGTTGTNTLKIGVVNTGDITIGKSQTNVNIDGTLKTNSINSTGSNSLTMGTDTAAYNSLIKLNNDGTVEIGATNNTVTINGTLTANLSGYATTASLGSYATTESLGSYATTASLGSYIATSNLFTRSYSAESRITATYDQFEHPILEAQTLVARNVYVIKFNGTDGYNNKFAAEYGTTVSITYGSSAGNNGNSLRVNFSAGFNVAPTVFITPNTTNPNEGYASGSYTTVNDMAAKVNFSVYHTSSTFFIIMVYNPDRDNGGNTCFNYVALGTCS
jgi:hypothetical protein